MKNRKLFSITIILSLLLVSCKMENTPEEYFDRAALNTNLLMQFGSRDFKDLQARKLSDLWVVENRKSKQGAPSYTAYIKSNQFSQINNAIEKIKDLKPTTETKPMIDASLELFGFVKQKYETDYIKIAGMIDAKAPQQDIDDAIASMEKESFSTIDGLYKKLMDIALPYAKKHGIKVTQNKF